ncbi:MULTISPECIES: cell division protein SepF [Cytobacillus]|uniref:Cell division protein SepF n=1 Tax=Cytobacillus stercorigallinarum TaxID=2762240 RepID=A0ABR8QMR9_9BACI|nr:cell division protein SepF [Cytobacillus stercorigallinarum]MBD7936800.1 cell division protein SepF [Cytobacillus stercorigallinarum]
MSIKSKFKSYFFLDDEEDNYEPREDEYANSRDRKEEQETTSIRTSQRQHAATKQNVVSLQSVQGQGGQQKSSKVVLVEPRVYAEAQEIADQLKNRKAVVVNLQRIDKSQAKRIVDFLSGTVYAIGGDIQKIGMDIFLCTPENVEVSGNISQMIQEHEEENSRW